MTLQAVIPVNRLDRAKGRLDGVLSPEERRGLALATLGTVVRACLEAGLEPAVLTADEAVAAALDNRVQHIPESPGVEGLNAQLEQAIAGLDEVVIVHADLPLARGAELRAIVEGSPPGPSITVVRSPDGGTNVMYLRPAGAIALSYGADSWRKHSEAAAASGIEVRTAMAPSLEVDLDTPADLAAFFATLGWESTEAGRFLAARGVPARLRATAEGHRR